MRVVVITGRDAHHKNLCARLVATGHVVGILHPTEPRPSKASQLRRIYKQAKIRGWLLISMYLLGKLIPRSTIKSTTNPKANSASHLFDNADEQYLRIPKALLYPNCNFKDKSTLDLIHSLRPDMTVCLGGPVYPRGIIEAAPLTLNFHSGISPLYNGTSSIKFAYANGHPHLCGGTLMVMNTEIDGGTILGHYLPEIEAGDTPASLFAKTGNGAAIMYERVLSALQPESVGLFRVPQPSPLFLTRGFDLTCYQTAMISRNVLLDVPAKHIRHESIVEYWKADSSDAARLLLEKTLDDLLWGRPLQSV